MFNFFCTFRAISLLFVFASFTIPVLLHPASIIWENTNIQLTAENGYLKLSLKRGGRFLHQLEDNEILALEKTAARMEHVFREVFECGDYIRFIPLNKEFEMHLIPTGAFTTPDTLNLQVNALAMLEMLGNQEKCTPSLPQDQIEKIETVAQRILVQDQLPIIPLGALEIKFRQEKESFELVQNAIEQRDPSSEKLIWVDQTEQNYGRVVDTCCRAFCNSDVIKKQLIFSGTHNYVISNHRPYAEQHYMVLPMRHICKISEQTDEEILEKFRLISRIGFIFKHILKSPAQVVINRCGWIAGQTQPHLHDHVIGYDSLAVQHWMKAWTYAMTHPETSHLASLSEEDMQKMHMLIAPFFSYIKAIGWDYGGVLVKQHFGEIPFLMEYFQVSKEQIEKASGKNYLLWTKGEMPEETFWKTVSRQLGKEMSDEEYVVFSKKWKACYLESNSMDEQACELVQDMKAQGFFTPLFSNTCPSHAEMNEQRNGYDFFKPYPILLSHQVGVIKPDPRAYHMLAESVHVLPSEMVYLDDRSENVKFLGLINCQNSRYLGCCENPAVL